MAGIRCIAIRRHDAFLKKFKAISITYSNCTIRVVRFLQGINRTDHCRILRNFSRKNKDFKYKTLKFVSRNLWNPTAFFFQATIEEQNENPIDFLSECIFVSKAHEKTKSFWKGESCTSERKWCGNHKRRLYASSLGSKCQLELIFCWCLLSFLPGWMPIFLP